MPLKLCRILRMRYVIDHSARWRIATRSKDPDLLRLLRKANSVGQGKRTDLREPKGESPRGCVSDDQTGKAADRLARDAPDEYEQVKAGGLGTGGKVGSRR